MADGPSFEAPWQAQLHALTVALLDAGAFGGAEWSKALGARTGAPDADPDGADHYVRHAEALLALLQAKRIATEAEVRAMASAWADAARRTPHGEPIVLQRA